MHEIASFFANLVQKAQPEVIVLFGDSFMNLGLILEGFFILRSKGLQKIEVIIYLCFVITSISYTLLGHRTQNEAQFYLNFSAFCVQLFILSTLSYRGLIKKQKIFWNFYQEKKKSVIHHLIKR